MSDLRQAMEPPTHQKAEDGQQQGRIVQVFQSPKAVVTYRAVVGVMMTIIMALITFLGTQIMAGQERMARDQERMVNAVTTLTDQVAFTKNQTDRNTAELGDHEHRITVLEVMTSSQPSRENR